MSQMDAMSIQPLVHSLHLWYYPPYVMDVCTDFKLAACGYVKCLDTLIVRLKLAFCTTCAVRILVLAQGSSF